MIKNAMNNNIRPLLNPDSIAVIGASRHEEKIGHIILKNILESGFQGTVYPVNPHAREILNQKVYPSVLKINSSVDLAVIAVPANIVPQVLEECGQAGIKAAVIISAGFAESGRPGQKRQEKISAIADKYNISLLGPNCLGFINTNQNINASWGSQMPRPGNVAFLSQSGAICSPVLEISRQRGLGFSYFISLGNKANLGENDLLEFLAEDKSTEVIIAYLESFQNGRALISLAQEISRQKPIIFLKAGVSSTGAQAAQSHTASLATPGEITRGVLKQAGIIQADNLKELINLAIVFSHNKDRTMGERLAIITNGGGPSVLAADAVADCPQLTMAELNSTTQRALNKFLPKAASVNNPVDLLGTAAADTYRKTTQTLIEDKEIDAILEILTKQRGTKAKEIAAAISQTAAETNKPIINCFMGGESLKEAKEVFKKASLTSFIYPEEAVKSAAQLQSWQNRILYPLADKTALKCARINRIINQAREQGQKLLNEKDGFAVLEAADIATPKHTVITAETNLKKAWKQVAPNGFLKVLSSQLAHKTEQGGVVQVTSGEDLETKVADMTESFDFPLILEKTVGEEELILGTKTDPSFGATIMAGAGGIYTEVLQDTAFRTAPIKKKGAQNMLEELKIYPILAGVRGQKAVNMKKLTQTIARLSQLAYQIKAIKEIDINPLKVSPQAATAVDVKIYLR